MEKFVYSNLEGTYLIDEGKVIASRKFSDKIKAGQALENNEWLPEEQELLGSEKIVFLGYKNEKPEHVILSNDQKKLELAVSLTPNEKLRDVIITLAKSKVKESVKTDELAIQTAASMQEIDKSANLLMKRLREWHGLLNPELSSYTEDNEKFVQEVLSGNDKSEMGVEVRNEDKAEIISLAEHITKLLELRNTYPGFMPVLYEM